MLLIKIHFGLLYVAGETVMKTVNLKKKKNCFDYSFLFILFYILLLTMTKRLCTSVFVTKQKQINQSLLS